MHLAINGELAGLLAVSGSHQKVPVSTCHPEGRVTYRDGNRRWSHHCTFEVAARLVIDEVHGGRPADKLELVSKLQKEGSHRGYGW